MALEADRPVAEIVKDIVSNLQQIVRAEIRLAKVEAREELAKAIQGAKLIGIGAVVGIFAVGVLLLSAVYALSLVLAPWAAALIVGIAVAVIAGVCVMAGLDRFKQVRIPPPKTAATLEENVQWAKAQSK